VKVNLYYDCIEVAVTLEDVHAEDFTQEDHDQGVADDAALDAAVRFCKDNLGGPNWTGYHGSEIDWEG